MRKLIEGEKSAEELAEEGVHLLFNAFKERGHPFEVGQGDIKTKEHLQGIRADIKNILLAEIERSRSGRGQSP